tara:strand:+ start:9796 stop:11103 length:1308 start_codon:yes stop_codon:yes gene_type:complete
MKKLSKKLASAELDKILESVAKPKVRRAQQISQLKNRLNEQLKGAESTPGINITNKVLKDGGKQNKDALKLVATKLKDYLNMKNNSHAEFPHQNNSKTDYNSPMYRNSTDQEEYIDDWRGGGLADLEYDTDPGDDFGKRFKKYLDGSSETGNAQSNKDGDLGNVVSNKVGDRIQKTLQRKHKKLKGNDGFAIPNDWTQHPNAGHIPKLAEAYEDDIDAAIDMEEEEAYMGAPSQVEKRDTYDGRPGKVVGVYSNINKQRDMDEGHVEGHEDEADLEEWEINLPFSQLRDVSMQHHGDNPLANMQLTSNPALNPEMLNFGHGGASDVNVVDGEVYDDGEDGEDYEWKKGEFRDEESDEFSDEEFSDEEFADEEFAGDEFSDDETIDNEFADDVYFDDVGNKSFNDVETEDKLSLSENVKRDMKSMRHLIGYTKNTQ